jgi:predicted RNase H-like HicB family nuclease
MPTTATESRNLTIEFDREDDGRWIADIPELPGVMVYGESKEDALKKVQELAFRVLADEVREQGQLISSVRFSFA